MEPWQPGVLETTDTWTGLQAWREGRKEEEITHDSSYLKDLKLTESLLVMDSDMKPFRESEHA